MYRTWFQDLSQSPEVSNLKDVLSNIIMNIIVAIVKLFALKDNDLRTFVVTYSLRSGDKIVSDTMLISKISGTCNMCTPIKDKPQSRLTPSTASWEIFLHA